MIYFFNVSKLTPYTTIQFQNAIVTTTLKLVTLTLLYSLPRVIEPEESVTTANTIPKAEIVSFVSRATIKAMSQALLTHALMIQMFANVSIAHFF